MSQGPLGRYQIVRELGSGATGTVFLAQRVQDFEQTVVLKVLRWTPFTNLADEPMESEHVILRSLEHPNIVVLLDHGRTADGAPILVLEHLDGTTIDEWCDSRCLSIRERLSLLRQIFSAVTYAHSHLVLHGDIKPTNVMVIPSPSGTGDPIVKLLDFGISRWLHKGRSVSGLMGATVGYASPEQRRGDVLTVATDVYALGLLMRSLLSGVEAVSPNGKKSLTSAHFQSLGSARQKELAKQRATTPRALVRTLRGSLDAIIEKATTFEPENRYVSVVMMADDVRRYMNDLETSVYPLARPQQAKLWMQRHAWMSGLALMMLTILLAGGSLTVWHHHRVALQEQETHARLLELAHLTDDLSGKLYRSTESLPGTEHARASLLRAASTARDAVAQQNASDPQLALELARQYEQAAELEVAGSDKQSYLQAQREIDTANSLLNYVPDSPTRSEIAEKINRLQLRLSTSS